MENTKKQQVGASSSSSSFTTDLFGPKHPSPHPSPSPSSSSTALFDSVFGPPSTGLGRDSPHLRRRDLGSQYGNSKHGDTANAPQRGQQGENSGTYSGKNTSSMYQKETVEPCCYSSSLYYGGQEAYSPNTETTTTHHVMKKDGGDDDPNGNNSASRGNWWQGSLYY